MLEGSAEPGEGWTVLTGHNHLNTMEAGPFALLSHLAVGDKIFVTGPDGGMKVFTVYASEKIAADDAAGLETIARMHENSLTLLTCEDERAGGGCASRRVVAAF
ncbi:MAG: class F sortase [Anaerolineaceae bacterium]|nr:class F sortase [Anaerolineaceae bacterium]